MSTITINQLLSEKFNKLVDDFEKRNNCIIKDLNFIIYVPKPKNNKTTR